MKTTIEQIEENKMKLIELCMDFTGMDDISVLVKVLTTNLNGFFDTEDAIIVPEYAQHAVFITTNVIAFLVALDESIKKQFRLEQLEKELVIN